MVDVRKGISYWFETENPLEDTPPKHRVNVLIIENFGIVGQIERGIKQLWAPIDCYETKICLDLENSSARVKLVCFDSYCGQIPLNDDWRGISNGEIKRDNLLQDRYDSRGVEYRVQEKLRTGGFNA